MAFGVNVGAACSRPSKADVTDRPAGAVEQLHGVGGFGVVVAAAHDGGPSGSNEKLAASPLPLSSPDGVNSDHLEADFLLLRRLFCFRD